MSSYWTPELIVELVKAVSWPVSFILFLVIFRVMWGGSFRKFFARNTFSEISASTTGVTAKFREADQQSDLLGSTKPLTAGITDRTDIAKIRKTHEMNSTEYSEDLYNDIILHMEVLDENKDTQIELLAKDCSLYRSALIYQEVNNLIYRSQYNLLQSISNSDNSLSMLDARRHFDSVVAVNPDSYKGWDLEKYTSFLMAYRFMVLEGNCYVLTKLGRSYLVFMSRNPSVVSDLHSI